VTIADWTAELEAPLFTTQNARPSPRVIEQELQAWKNAASILS
jgi:hypothetical protein